jgi:hypothetical protein
MDRATVSVMRSYPNLIPVNAATITLIETMLAPLVYDRIYGAFAGRASSATRVARSNGRSTGIAPRFSSRACRQ